MKIRDMEQFIEVIKKTKHDVEMALKTANKQDFSDMSWNSVQGYLSSALRNLDKL